MLLRKIRIGWFLLALLPLTGVGQDTARKASTPYILFSPAYYNGAGTRAEKTNLGIEVGKEFGVFDLGFVVGMNGLDRPGRDSAFYCEVRPTLDVFTEGKFSSTFTIGIGHMFGAKTNLMTEIAYGITYVPNSRFFFGLYQGQYWFDGKKSANFNTAVTAFFGYYLVNRRYKHKSDN